MQKVPISNLKYAGTADFREISVFKKCEDFPVVCYSSNVLTEMSQLPPSSCYQLLPAVTSCYDLLRPVNTCYHLLPPFTTYYHLLPPVTSFYQLLPAATSCYQLLQPVTTCYQLLPAVTSCCQLSPGHIWGLRAIPMEISPVIWQSPHVMWCIAFNPYICLRFFLYNFFY